MHVQLTKSFTKGLSKFGNNAGLRSVAVYTFSNFFSKGISFILLFYFARVFSESDFGMLNLFVNGILFLMPFVSLGILQSASTEFFKKDKKEFSIFFSSTLVMPVIMAMLITGLFFIFRHPLQQWYSFPITFIVLIPLATLFSFLNEHLINMIRNSNEPVKYLYVNIGRLLAEIALAVFFISAYNCGWVGRVTGICISYLMVAMYAFYYFKQRSFLVKSFQKKYVYDELQYSVPIIAMQLAIFFMSASGGYFIKYFTGNYAAVGVFSVAAALASVIPVLGSALTQYVYPKIYGMLSQPRVNYNGICRLFVFYTGAMLLFTIAIISCLPLVYHVALKPSYSEGLSYCYLICIGYFFWSVTYFFYAFMLYHKQKRKILFASALSIIVSVSMHLLFTKKFGAYGAALSICGTYLLVLIATTIIVYKQLLPVFKNFTANRNHP
ncbi:MAG: oligosaccharide flippase family protein [Bacteroidota bacterium]